MSYKLISEDEHKFMVRHPDGSQFAIAKQHIGPEVHKRIKQFEPVKMAEGGEVPEVEEDAPLDPRLVSPMAAPESSREGLFESLGFGKFASDAPEVAAAPAVGEPAPEPQPTAPVVTGPAPASAAPPQPASQPVAPITETDPYAQAFAQKSSGIQDAAAAQARAAQDQAKIYEDQANQIAEQQRRYEAKHAEIDAEHKQLTDAVMNEKIDPNRLFSNMGVGNKILAAISVALSGIGAGLTGKENMAMGVIQKSIDRDIEAQRAELGKKQTLLSENVRRYGDLETATRMTQLQMNAVTQAKIAQVAARSGSAQAAANAKMMLGDLNMQAAAIKQKIAQDRVVSEMAQRGGASDAQIQSLPKEVRERSVKIGDKYVLALDDQSAKDARKIVGSHDAMMSNLDKLIQLREKYGSETVPGKVKAEMKTIATNLQLAMKEANQLGTLDKGAEKFMERLVADPTSFGFVADQYRALKETQNRTSAQKLKALGIGAGMDHFSNPEIKTVNGVKLMRGPNGQAVPVK